MNIPYVFKKCTKCGEWLVANNSNFSKNKACRYGLNSYCKKCKVKYQKKYYRENIEKCKEYKREYNINNKAKLKEYKSNYYKNNKDIVLGKCKKYYENNKEEILEYHKEYYEENKNSIKKYKKKHYKSNKKYILAKNNEYYIENKDRILQINKLYYQKNKCHLSKLARKYYKENKIRIAEWNKQYKIKNPDKVINNRAKRRYRTNNQGNGITKEQWFEMMKYFNWRCAYSGENVWDSNVRSIDHIIPLRHGGLHEINNLVPMFRNYNSSKNDKDILEWYKQQDFYSEERLQKIYEWQEYAKSKWSKTNLDCTLKK